MIKMGETVELRVELRDLDGELGRRRYMRKER